MRNPPSLVHTLYAMLIAIVFLSNAHCQSPLCNPSRTSLMLSRRPTSTGVYGLAPWFRNLPEHEKRVTLPQHFADNGYRTLAAGKIFHYGTAGPGQRGRQRAGQLQAADSFDAAPVEFQVRGPSPGVGAKPPEKLIPPTPMGNSLFRYSEVVRLVP